MKKSRIQLTSCFLMSRCFIGEMDEQVTVEILSKLTDVSENVLDFGLNPEDEDVKYLRQLVELKDGIVDLPDIDYEDKVEGI